MHDLDKTRQTKERIISTIRFKGPSLPVQLARALAIEPIFASAFLSELKAEEKLKVSDMKVGSSPVYYLAGQEDKLENYVQHLNQREREAFNLLKKEKILEDETQTPVVRVALRAIKDFAIPVRVRINEQVKTFWKYYLVPDAEMSSIIESILYPERKQQKQEQKIEKEIKEAIAPQQEISNPILEKPKEIIAQTPAPAIAQTKESIAPKQQKLIEEPKQIKEAKKQKQKLKKEKKPKEFAFPKNLKEYLQEKDIELLEIIEEKNKELTAKIRIDSLFGKQSFYLIAKDKKKISQDDLTIALQKAQAEKMPALFLSPGELDKKALPHLKDWNNLIKFEKIKL